MSLNHHYTVLLYREDASPLLQPVLLLADTHLSISDNNAVVDVAVAMEHDRCNGRELQKIANGQEE